LGGKFAVTACCIVPGASPAAEPEQKALEITELPQTPNSETIATRIVFIERERIS